ncbi:MAG: pyridoxamine 5'-phosphate oxidase [Thermoanaerobaculia bacterium]|nr:MAG: pyridoxamine 5'-phosphate oxidase [Thermoanaerobaculia bacterium]
MAGAPEAPAAWPLAEFEEVFARARRSAPFDPTAVALATADAGGRPSVRMVLLKGADARGLRFFTNYESRKGRELAANPRAALCFYWPWIDEQVRAEGTVEVLPGPESDVYFASRPRGSQLGAWASRQSEPLTSRFALLRRVAAVEARHFGRAVPRPPHWGGYLLRPDSLEIWRSRPSRIHERRRWALGPRGGSWERLQP